MNTYKLLLALVISFQFSYIPLAQAGINSSSQSVAYLVNSVKKEHRGEKPTVNSTLNKIKEFVPEESFRLLKRNIPKQLLDDRIEMEVQGTKLTIKSDDAEVTIDIVGKKRTFARVNGVVLSLHDIRNMNKGIKKLNRNFRSSRHENSKEAGLLALLSLSVNEADAFNWALFGGLALIGVGLLGAGYFLSNATTTHEVKVDPIEVSPIVVEPIEGEIRVPVSIEVPQLNTSGAGTGGTFGRPRVR